MTLLLKRLAVVLGLVTCAACGGGSNPAAAPTPTPPPTPAPPRVVTEASGFSLEQSYVLADNFAIGSAGTLEATIDFTYPQTDLLVWIAKGDCSFEQWANEQCTYVATSFAGSKPRKVSATGLTSGNYVILIWNAGPNDESLSYQVLFTATGTASGVPAVSSRPASAPFLRRMPPR